MASLGPPGAGDRMREIDIYLSAVTRQLRTVRGVWRISERLRRRFVRHYAAKGNPSVVIDDFEGDLRLRVDRSSMIGSLIYWNGSFSPNELAVLGRILEPDMVFADVGANQGELTVFAASRLPHGHVLAFEPMESLHRQLLEASRSTASRTSSPTAWRSPTDRDA